MNDWPNDPRAPEPELTTERLRLQPFAPTDATALLHVFRDPDVRRFLLDDEVVQPSWVDEEIRSSTDRFRSGGAGLWAIRARGGHDDQRVHGFVGFRPFFHPPRLQLLYGLSPESWGRGYATEAAGRVAAYGFEALGFEEIEAATDVPNVRSASVLARLGFTLERISGDGLHGTAFYRLTHDLWQQR